MSRLVPSLLTLKRRRLIILRLFFLLLRSFCEKRLPSMLARIFASLQELSSSLRDLSWDYFASCSRVILSSSNFFSSISISSYIISFWTAISARFWPTTLSACLSLSSCAIKTAYTSELSVFFASGSILSTKSIVLFSSTTTLPVYFGD